MSSGTSGVPTAVLQRVAALVGRVLNMAPGEIGEDAAFGITEGWDSLAQLNILTIIEQEFDITIEPEESVDLASVVEIATFLTARHAA